MKHLRAIIESPKTTAPGLAMILGAVGLIVRDWKALFDAQQVTVIISALLGGAGLLMAAQIEPGKMPKPQEPPAAPQ